MMWLPESPETWSQTSFGLAILTKAPRCLP